MTSAFWPQFLAVTAGSLVGAWLRWASAVWFNQRWHGFPLGTLLVNCAGGLMMGFFLAYFERTSNDVLRLLLLTGFLGGLTTFSAFTGESLLLLQRGAWGLAIAHTLAHVFGALACAAVGFRLGRLLWA